MLYRHPVEPQTSFWEETFSDSTVRKGSEPVQLASSHSVQAAKAQSSGRSQSSQVESDRDRRRFKSEPYVSKCMYYTCVYVCIMYAYIYIYIDMYMSM